MNRTRTIRLLSLRAAAVAFVLLLASAGSLASAQNQAEDITFEVERYRVDLVRDDDGEIAERFVEVTEAVPGEVVEYRVTATNEGERIYRAGTVVVTLPIGEDLAYVEDSAGPASDDLVLIEFSADGGESFAEPPVLLGEGDDQSTAAPEDYDTIRWTFTVPFEPDQEETLYYRVEVL